MRQPTPYPGSGKLDALVGEWELRALINREQVGLGSTRFEWMESGAFLVQRTGDEHSQQDTSTDWAENAPDAVTMIIGLDDTNDCYSALYADSRNVFRVYQMTLDHRVWTLWRYAPGFSQRFTGTFSQDANTIDGRWESSVDGEHWEPDFDLIYSRKG